MNKAFIAAIAATTALTGVLPAGAAAAQTGYYQDRYRDTDRDGRPDAREWNRDRDRDGRPDQYDRRDQRDSDGDGRPDAREWNRDRDRDGRPDQYDRRDRRSDARGYRGERQLRYYGGQYGYQGYQGRWRTGQRYPYYNNRQYVISDYQAYNLPPPRAGYRYYRDNNGDVVMAAIVSGVIGLIIGGALNDNDRGYYR